MKQVRQILELLDDTSFPRVILLDGAWGSGKTHFIKHQLINELKNKHGANIYFFSLYGISSIDDFRDKIISLSITETEEASVISKYFAKIVDGAAINIGERGVGAIINGVTGAYKYKLYGELDDCIIILDDLERVVDEKIIKNILGECLSLAESKNIKIIVVANESKLKCKDDIEKVFADKYMFSFTHEEVVNILRQSYNCLDEQLANELLLNITAIDSRNIRVLKRALAKFIRIKNEIEKIDNVVLDQALSRVLSGIIRICHAKFECGFSKEKIIEAIETRLIRRMAKDQEVIENSEYKKLDNIFTDNLHNLSNKLITYCCDGLFEFNDLKEELNIPIQQTLLDKMKSRWSQNLLTDEEFNNGVKELESFISTATEIDIDEWFSVCDTYLYMLDMKIIMPSIYSKETLLEVCEGVDIKNFKLPSNHERFEHDSLSSFYDQNLNAIYISKRKQLNSLDEENRNGDFIHDFIQSWDNVKNHAFQELMHKPIYNILNENIVKDALYSWSNEEVFQFLRFNRSRYRFNNIQDFFVAEIDALKTISVMLDTSIEELRFGLKVASIIELRNCFVDAYTRMENSLRINNSSETNN